jgi:fermentation-respiration switch protein FrsA (DUF1100 family)
MAGIVATYLGVLYFVQRSLIFPAPRRQPDLAYNAVEKVQLAVHDGSTYGLFLSTKEKSARAPLIIFSHGNAELAADWLYDFRSVTEWAAVLLVEYPGYGGAHGAPTESSIRDAMTAAYDWAVKDPRVDPSKIVVYGRSLGSGAAARLAVDRKAAALILESSFTSVADFARRFLAPQFLVRDRFDNREALKSYRGPLLLIHGRRDAVVPIEHARELVTIVPGARLHEIDCGHNDCPRQWAVIRAFLGE